MVSEKIVRLQYAGKNSGKRNAYVADKKQKIYE